MVAAMTPIRAVFGIALSLHHTQRARFRQRPTRRKRVLRSRRIGVIGGGIRIARDEDIGMLGALTFFLRQLHEWNAIPAAGSPASRSATPPARRGRRGHGASAGSPHPPPRY